MGVETVVKEKRPQVHIYFGEGKGKTTAALGQALRAWGQGWRVLFVQFLKDSADPSGEGAASAALGKRWVLRRSRLPCSAIARPSAAEREELRKETRRMLKGAVDSIASGKFDAVILDEILVAWKLGLVRVKEIRKAVDAAGEAGVRIIVLTGRWAPKSLVGSADLVTEVRKVKHPYDRGEGAREGIDF